MGEFRKPFSAALIFLICLSSTFVFVGFGQTTQPPDCRKKYSLCKASEYTKIIELNPTDAIAYYNRGLAYHLALKSDEAISDFSRVIELDPKFPEVYRFRGHAYSVKKEYDQAIADYNKAIEFDPTDADSYYGRGAAYGSKNHSVPSTNDYDMAVADYKKAIELDPTNWSFYYVRGWFYYNNGKKTLAEADFRKAKELENLDERNKSDVKGVRPRYPQFP